MKHIEISPKNLKNIVNDSTNIVTNVIINRKKTLPVIIPIIFIIIIWIYFYKFDEWYYKLSIHFNPPQYMIYLVPERNEGVYRPVEPTIDTITEIIINGTSIPKDVLLSKYYYKNDFHGILSKNDHPEKGFFIFDDSIISQPSVVIEIRNDSAYANRSIVLDAYIHRDIFGRIIRYTLYRNVEFTSFPSEATAYLPIYDYEENNFKTEVFQTPFSIELEVGEYGGVNFQKYNGIFQGVINNLVITESNIIPNVVLNKSVLIENCLPNYLKVLSNDRVYRNQYGILLPKGEHKVVFTVDNKYKGFVTEEKTINIRDDDREISLENIYMNRIINVLTNPENARISYNRESFISPAEIKMSGTNNVLNISKEHYRSVRKTLDIYDFNFKDNVVNVNLELLPTFFTVNKNYTDAILFDVLLNQKELTERITRLNLDSEKNEFNLIVENNDPYYDLTSVSLNNDIIHTNSMIDIYAGENYRLDLLFNLKNTIVNFVLHDKITEKEEDDVKIFVKRTTSPDTKVFTETNINFEMSSIADTSVFIIQKPGYKDIIHDIILIPGQTFTIDTYIEPIEIPITFSVNDSETNQNIDDYKFIITPDLDYNIHNNYLIINNLKSNKRNINFEILADGYNRFIFNEYISVNNDYEFDIMLEPITIEIISNRSARRILLNNNELKEDYYDVFEFNSNYRYIIRNDYVGNRLWGNHEIEIQTGIFRRNPKVEINVNDYKNYYYDFTE